MCALRYSCRSRRLDGPLDENFPLPIVDEWRRLGHDVETVVEAGFAGQGVRDGDVLDDAILKGRAVLAVNRKHIIRLHRQRSEHARIMVCTADHDFAAQARRIHVALCTEPDLFHRLIRVNGQGLRSPPVPDHAGRP
jgi:uncharacterized protein DUF5615